MFTGSLNVLFAQMAVNVCRLLGVDRVVAFALTEWLQDIKRNQLPSLLGGVGPLYSLVQLGQCISLSLCVSSASPVYLFAVFNRCSSLSLMNSVTHLLQLELQQFHVLRMAEDHKSCPQQLVKNIAGL